MRWFSRGNKAESGEGDDLRNFKAPSDEPKDRGRREFLKVFGAGAAALAVEAALPDEVKAALDQREKKVGAGAERADGKRVEIKGIQDEATQRRVQAEIDAFLANPQLKFSGAAPSRAASGPLSLEFGQVVQGPATMNDLKRQGKQNADNEIIRSTGSMGNTANTGTMAGRARQTGERMLGAAIAGVLRNRSDKVFGHPEGDISVPIMVYSGRPRGEIAPYVVQVRYAMNERTGKISLKGERSQGRVLPGSAPTAERYTSGNQELYNEAIVRAIEAAIADARTEGPVKSALALELMMYASAPASNAERQQPRPREESSRATEATSDGMVPMHRKAEQGQTTGSEVLRPPDANSAKDRPAPQKLPVRRRN